jgi:putative mRNA 3-end processing factor
VRSDYQLDVAASGAVLLGPSISCDGFHYSSDVRVQTHIHDDHMMEFETSKGNQLIVTSDATFALLENDLNADIPYRQNIKALKPPAIFNYEDTEIALVSSQHMLGSVQVAVTSPGAPCIGYSGDFQWPLERVITVEALVVDSTYGSPESLRKYSQDEAEERFLTLVIDRLRYGPVHVNAHRGTIQRALQILSGNVTCPLLGSPRLCAEVEVYRQFGYPIDVTATSATEIKPDRFIMFYGKSDGKPVDPDGSTISLSAFMSKADDPVLRYSERAYRVALSNHADFEGTLEYVEATGAQYVVADNTRGRGVELAQEIASRLGITARPSLGEATYEWGG